VATAEQVEGSKIDKRHFRRLLSVGAFRKAAFRMNTPVPVYFTAARSLQERAGLRAGVDQVTFAPSLDAPEDRPFPFIYGVTIYNDSDATITLKARKWILTDLTSGHRHVIEGDGVAGCFPRIEPGESFGYESYHVVAGNSYVEGSYLASDDAGAPVLVRIPAFTVRVEQARDGFPA
jgi:ApaG protein